MSVAIKEIDCFPKVCSYALAYKDFSQLYTSCCSNGYYQHTEICCPIPQADSLHAMNARISRLVYDKYYYLLKDLGDLAKVWLSLFHYQMLWQNILILQYGFVLLELYLYVFCMHFPKLICHKKYKGRLIIIYLSQLFN